MAATSLAPEEVGAEEMWVTRAIPTELLSNTKKSCGVLERQHPLWDSSPRSSDWKSDALSIRPRGPVLMGQAKLRNLCGTGRDPLWLKARKSSKTCGGDGQKPLGH